MNKGRGEDTQIIVKRQTRVHTTIKEGIENTITHVIFRYSLSTASLHPTRHNKPSVLECL